MQKVGDSAGGHEISKRILPISSIRFVLAMWVVIGHYGLPILREPQHDSLLWAIRALLNNAFNGPAAVVVFFVISGFCIHFPNRKELQVGSWKQYYARRYLRILIPMGVAIALSTLLGMQFGLFTDSILWSLLCEEIYYFLYPGLLALRGRIGWPKLNAISWGAALLVVLTAPLSKAYPSYGPALNWVLGLPCWLLGCTLAERLESFNSIPVSVRQIWLWRGGAWLLSAIFSLMRFHTPIGYPWTLSLFALYAALWLEREIRYYQDPSRKPLFEQLGEASYSIYLTHTHSQALLVILGISIWGGNHNTTWLVGLILCGSVATVFYWAVERPSHKLARRFAKRTKAVRMAAAVSALSRS